MRIFQDCFEMIREVERDVWEMGVKVQPETMQDKVVKDDPEYMTLEITPYAFSVTSPSKERNKMLTYFAMSTPGRATTENEREAQDLKEYCEEEIFTRVSGKILNPGTSWLKRPEVWNEFIHEGKFAYTYSERISPQLDRVLSELTLRPNTRQAIVNIHSNFAGDIQQMGGHGRVPCSMYYQLMRRKNGLDLIYTMRSCDLLTHFPVDVWLATGLQIVAAQRLNVPVGMFSMFIGSLHAYFKDVKKRGVF